MPQTYADPICHHFRLTHGGWQLIVQNARSQIPFGGPGSKAVKESKKNHVRKARNQALSWVKTFMASCPSEQRKASLSMHPSICSFPFESLCVSLGCERLGSAYSVPLPHSFQPSVLSDGHKTLQSRILQGKSRARNFLVPQLGRSSAVCARVLSTL